MNMERATTEFLGEIRRRGYSDRTIKAYSHDLEKLCIYLKNTQRFDGASNELDSLDNESLRGWIDELLTRGNKLKSVARKVATLKSFFRFLYTENMIPANPAEKLSLPRIPKRPPSALSQEEIRQLLNSPEPGEPDYYLDRAILFLLYSGGLRVSELANLRIDNINLERQHIRILGKGAKERLIPLQNSSRTAILDYLEYREKHISEFLIPKNPLFLKKTGKGVRQLNIRMIQYLVEKHGKRAGLMSHIHPHLIRHSIATHMIEQGASVESVRQTLGHEDLATTSIYLKASSKFLYEEHKKYNPIDALTKSNR